MHTNKRKIIFVSIDEFINLITGKTRITNIPEDCEIVSAYWNIEKYGFDLILRSDRFTNVPQGACLPMFIAGCEEVKNR